ncbi:DUF6362 family protein [Paracoccaceae bacterium Fryx2]|nr:DUF6362 family protein [Paracoccaceae bacterium Fryx2]
MPITPREIEDQFEDAALTLRRLPNPPGSGAKGFGQSWPEYVHDAKQAYGYDEVRMRVVPSARDIQRMEDCIGWLAWLDPEDARIVWLRAEGVRWRQVCIRAGVVRSTAWRRWAASLLTIAKHLNALEKSGRKASAPKRVADRNVVKPFESGSDTLL